MALPSQTERTSEMSRPVMARPAGKGGGVPKPALIGGGVIVLMAVTFVGVSILLPAKSKTQDKPADPPKVTEAGKDAKPAAKSLLDTPPKSLSQPTPGTLANGSTPPANKPLELNQGAGSPGTPGSLVTPADSTKPAPVDVTSKDLKPTPPTTPPATPAAGTPGSTPTEPLLGSGSTSQVRGFIEAGDRAMSSGKPLEARVAYSRALMSGDIGRSDADTLREKLTRINDDLVFSKTITPGDPLVESYTVQSGDSLVKIARKRQLATEWQLIERINKVDSRHLRVGAKLKLVRGPFHVIVHKSDFRVDLFAGSPDDQSDWLFIRSFKVGLGADGGTPVGNFRIKANSKLINPTWVNPRTGEKFAADDPKNPIGEYWLGWEGLGDSAAYKGFGLHGTIDPSSIGQEKSMGCVRMANDDVALVYELLVPEVSQVKVVP
ncbi:MAG: L,D-transpeptidase family protein [Tepidisphaera sp.]|nr:L,D-transpeptidase family protein [Tepidisphaera sp.]